MNLISPIAQQVVSRLRSSVKNVPVFNEEDSARIQSFLLDHLDKPMVLDAFFIAYWAHADQTRKYTEEPYILHPLDVALRIESLKEFTDDMVCAGLLHDVVEDTAVTKDEIFNVFGDKISSLVADLTWTPDKKILRKIRQKLLYEKLKHLGKDSKTIKLADIISNSVNLSEDIVDPKFVRLYLPEQYAKIQSLKGGDENLFLEAKKLVEKLATKMQIPLISSQITNTEPNQNKTKKVLKKQ